MEGLIVDNLKSLKRGHKSNRVGYIGGRVEN